MPDTEDNVTPPEELNRRRRVLQLVDDSTDLMLDLVDRFNELLELEDILQVLRIAAVNNKLVSRLSERLAPHVKEQVAKIARGEAGAEMAEILRNGQVEGANYAANIVSHYAQKYGLQGRHPLADVIQRLFDEAPKMTDAAGNPDPTQAPAIPMVMITMGSGAILQGTMSGEADGVLKVMAPATVANKEMMVEHFFRVDDIEAITVPRDITISQGGSRIIGASS